MEVDDIGATGVTPGGQERCPASLSSSQRVFGNHINHDLAGLVAGNGGHDPVALIGQVLIGGTSGEGRRLGCFLVWRRFLLGIDLRRPCRGRADARRGGSEGSWRGVSV
ncbi:MAG: hypothetical protein DLM54_00385 [Acidimicrobiales bacterium]|nr:MAG: hypothetical protein DLM54_00385 [Acidimicrobiales bacterium]